MSVGILLALVVAAATIVLQSSAATYPVGDGFGWNTPFGGFNFSNWAAQRTFAIDDILVFNFATGQHTAARVNQNDYDNCNTRGNPISLQTNGPANFTLNQTGPWYFICTVTNHCSSGQKLLVNVTSSPRSPSPSGSLSPGSSPTNPSSSLQPPPPPNSAISYVPPAAVASVTLLLTAIALLF